MILYRIALAIVVAVCLVLAISLSRRTPKAALWGGGSKPTLGPKTVRKHAVTVFATRPGLRFRRAISSICAIKSEWLGWGERRLGHDAWAIASVDLGSVDQERVAQVNSAGRAGHERHVPVCSRAAQLQVRRHCQLNGVEVSFRSPLG
jgi:hypothetical protein